MKRIVLTLFIVLFVKISIAQLTFQQTFGGALDDYGNSVRQTFDLGYIVAGYTKSFGSGNGDIYLIKTDSNGDTLWSKYYGGGGIDVAVSVRQTNDTGYIVAAYTTSFFDQSYDFYLIRTNSIGDKLWTKRYGSFGNTENEFTFSLCQTSDGGFVLVGLAGSIGLGFGDGFVVRTDSIGNKLWSRVYGSSLWGDNLYDIKQTNDGGLIMVGSTDGVGAGNQDFYLIKTDSVGDTLWTRTYGGFANEIAYSVLQTSDSRFVITGYTKSFGAGGSDVYLINTDLNGDTLWTKTYGGIADETAYAVESTNDGGYIIIGTTDSFGMDTTDIYIIKTDENGDTIWTRAFGGMGVDYGSSIQQTIDSGYILTGYTNSFNSGSNKYDVYLVKIDANGNGNGGCNQSNTPTIVNYTSTQIDYSKTDFANVGVANSPPSTIGAIFQNKNLLCSTVNSINEVFNGIDIDLFPNPSNGVFTISLSNLLTRCTVEIYSMVGELLLLKTSPMVQKIEISLRDISSGIYFAKVYDGQNYYCKRFIIRKY